MKIFSLLLKRISRMFRQHSGGGLASFMPARPPASSPSAVPPGTGVEPIESFAKTESVAGGQLFLGLREVTVRSPAGELIRQSHKQALLLGCGHVVQRVQPVGQVGTLVRGLGGQCYYCR